MCPWKKLCIFLTRNALEVEGGGQRDISQHQWRFLLGRIWKNNIFDADASDSIIKARENPNYCQVKNLMTWMLLKCFHVTEHPQRDQDFIWALALHIQMYSTTKSSLLQFTYNISGTIMKKLTCSCVISPGQSQVCFSQLKLRKIRHTLQEMLEI